MADSFSQLYIQLVFAVKNRNALITPSWEERLNQYTTGIVEGRGHKMLAIGGMPDHIHLFCGLKPTEAISDLVREIKKSTNNFINGHRLTRTHFDWQGGFGAFSYSRSQVNNVCQYILNQREHHRKKTFREEYLKLIQDFEIEIGSKTMFDFFD